MKEYKRNKEIISCTKIHGKHTQKFANSFIKTKKNNKEKTALRNLIKTKKDKLIRNDTRQKYE